jgi:type VI secretion system protein ImpA
MTNIALDKIVAPISQDNPCGIDIRLLDLSDPRAEQYEQLKELRNQLRREERKSVETDNTIVIVPKEWQKVINYAVILLSKHTKDIEITSWLLEGLTRVKSFSGLSEGLEVFSSLIEKYQKKLYPSLEEDEDDASRLASIAMLAGKYEIGTLIIPLYYHNIIVTNVGNNFNAWTIRQLLEKANVTEGDVRISALRESADLKSAIFDLEKEEFAEIYSRLEKLHSNFKKFNSVITKVFGRFTPSFTTLEKTINYCLGIAKSVNETTEVGNPTSASDDSDELNDQTQVTTNSRQQPVQNISLNSLTVAHINRQNAVQLLDLVADFFQESEPHSPISHTLKRAIRWLKLDISEFMCDVMQDERARDWYCKITGVPFVSSPDKESTHDEDDY